MEVVSRLQRHLDGFAAKTVLINRMPETSGHREPVNEYCCESGQRPEIKSNYEYFDGSMNSEFPLK